MGFVTRTPSLPPVAKPIIWTIWKSRAVIRAEGATKGGRRSVKIFRAQVGISQKNFRTVRKTRDFLPSTGKIGQSAVIATVNTGSNRATYGAMRDRLCGK